MNVIPAVKTPYGPIFRTSHVAGRPYVSTGEASRRLGKSLYWVTERIKNGTLDGYGIKANERTSWFVFESAVAELERLDGPDQRPRAVEALPQQGQLVLDALDAIEALSAAVLAEREVLAEVTESVMRTASSWSEHNDNTAAVIREVRDRLLEGPIQREPHRNAVDQHLHTLQKTLRAIQVVT